MTLPTFLVILFLLNENVYYEVAPAKSPEACQYVVDNIKTFIPKIFENLPEYYSASCVQPVLFLRDA